METPADLIGTWRIVEMEMWDQDAFDLLGPAFLEIEPEGQGRFRFIAVVGFMDCRFGERDGQPLIEFSWDGRDERDPATGRGWAVVDGEQMRGQIFIHLGDDSAFTARRTET